MNKKFIYFTILSALVFGSAAGSAVIGKWTQEEDQMLRDAIAEIGPRNWSSIARRVPGRSDNQCLQRWTKVLKPGLKKGSWTASEDALLKASIDMHGYGNWVAIAKLIDGRTPKQCRERWTQSLDPSISKADWTDSEDSLLLALVSSTGPRWAALSIHFPNRSTNQLKSRYHSLERARAKALQIRASQQELSGTPEQGDAESDEEGGDFDPTWDEIEALGERASEEAQEWHQGASAI